MNLDTYIRVILDRRWLVIALAVLLLLLAAGTRFFAITNDYRILFKDDNPELLAYNALKDIYAASDQALIAVAPQDQSVFTRQTLGAIEELTEAAWLVPYSTRVDSLTNFFYSEAHDEDLIVEPLAEDAHSLDDAELHRIESIATTEIDIVNRFVSSQGHVGAVLITFALPEDRDAAVTEITDRLDHLLTEYRGSHPQIDFYLTGDVVVNRAFSDATQDDLRTLTPIVFGIRRYIRDRASTFDLGHSCDCRRNELFGNFYHEAYWMGILICHQHTNADSLEFPKSSTLLTLFLFQLKEKFKHFRLGEQYIRSANFSSLLEISAYEDVGLSYRMPSHILA